MRVHTRTLRLFCDVVANHGYTRAAHAQGCTPAHASQSVAELEGVFGIRLAQHDCARFTLTPAGVVFHADTLKLIALESNLKRDMNRSRATTARTIQLASCYSYGLHQLQARLPHFQRAQPKLDVSVSYQPIAAVHKLVLDRAVDLGVVAYPRRLRELVVELISAERLVLVLPPGHRLAVGPAVPVMALRNLDIIAWAELPWAHFLAKVPDSQRALFEPRHEVRDLETVKQMVQRSLGVAVLPAATVASEVADQRLAAVPFADGQYSEPVGLIYRKDHKLTPAVKAFIQFMKQPQPQAG